MSFTLPDSTASGGLSHADTTVTQQKTNFTNLRGFLAELLGTSSASKATPRSLLGIDGANITAAVGSSALTIALKTAAGADPAATSSLPIPFRHATLTNGAVAVREVPAILGQVDARRLVLDVLDELSDLGDSGLVQARIDAVLSRMACHGSIRSGRQMRAEEMNALLREMEATPHSGQCNHGRPTYVELKLADIERLFGRT